MATSMAAGAVLGSTVWVAHLIHLIRHRDRVVFLATLPLPLPPAGPEEPGWPAVAVLFAARDEAQGVEAAVRSMLAEAEEDPALRVVAIDDRSTDGTGAILDRIAAAHPGLEVVHVRDLPPGWLGKTHALEIGSHSEGARAARWILLTDADVVFRPGSIRRAVSYAEQHGFDMVCVAPEVDTRSVGERVFLSMFGLLFSLYGPIGRLPDRNSRAHIGIGAFNLIRAEAFQAVGGFRHLTLSVDDDMRLGQTIKYAGYKLGYLFGRDAISVRWHEGAWGMIRGIEKNFFAGLKFQARRVVLVAGGIIVLGICPFVGLVVGPAWIRAVAVVGVLALTTILGASGMQSKIRWYYIGLIPVASLLILFALLRSTGTTLRRGGITWRGHHYPLRHLKAHIKDRDAWLDELWRSTR